MRRLWLLSTGVVLWAGCLPVPASPDAGPDAGVLSAADFTTDVSMRDGVTLHTSVFLPERAGPVSVVVVRNPFSWRNEDPRVRAWADRLRARGLGLVWQAVRGTGGSRGLFVPFAAELDDGEDTMRWLLGQPWSNGKVGAAGTGYAAYAAFALAAADAHVAVVLAEDTASDEGPSRAGGLVRASGLSFWADVERGAPLGEAERQAFTNALSLETLDEQLLGRDAPYWNELLLAGTSVYPRATSLRTLATRLCVPAIHVVEARNDWNDGFAAWEAASTRGCEAQRAHQWLVVAPEAAGTHFDALGGNETWVTEAWWTLLDAALSTAPVFPDWAPVRYRFDASDSTHTAQRWPPSSTGGKSFSLGGAPTLGGGTLLAEAPPDATWTLRSDPLNTDPCVMPTWTWFRSPALTAGLELLGAPRVTLITETLAPDFDLHFELYDLEPNEGTYRSLATGGLRARFRQGTEQALPPTPLTLTIPLSSTAQRVAAGHHLMLAVSPSRCEFAENPHTGEPLDAQTRWSTAEVVVRLGASGARLTLP